MRIHYDLHMHSGLSPCGDSDMTPGNLVNMAALAGLNMIALTDHNSALNCPAAQAAAQQVGITLVPGMELCTVEECHVLCLFSTVEQALAFGEQVYAGLPPVDNRPDIFGRQTIIDAADRDAGEVTRLLTTASSVSIDEVVATVRAAGGAALPAHVDRPSYSVTAVLGTVPAVGFCAAEVTATADIASLQDQYPLLEDLLLLVDSDAHDLIAIPDAGPWIELPACTPAALIDALNGLLPAVTNSREWLHR